MSLTTATRRKEKDDKLQTGRVSKIEKLTVLSAKLFFWGMITNLFNKAPMKNNILVGEEIVNFA